MEGPFALFGDCAPPLSWARLRPRRPRAASVAGFLAVSAAAGLFAVSARCQDAAPALRAAETGACSMQDAAPIMVAAVDRDFDVSLADGRRVSLAGVEFPVPTRQNPSLRERVHARLSNWIDGRQAFLVALSEVPDRWGRIPGRLYADGGGGEGGDASLVGVAEALLAAGEARFRPDAAAMACAEAFASAENRARERGLGLWADKDYFVVDANRREAFLDRKGMILIEGVINRIGETGGSVFLDFGPRRGVDFAAVIAKRNLGSFERAGLFPRKLIGRRARVRGLIETRFGPRMEILSPAAIEVPDDLSAR